MPSSGGWTGDWLLSYRSYHSIWGCDGYFCIQLPALPVWNQGAGVEWQCRSCIWFNTSCFFSVVNPSPHHQTLQKGNAWAVLGFSIRLFWNRKSNYGSTSTNSRSRNGECYGTPALNWISNHGRFFLGHLNPRIFWIEMFKFCALQNINMLSNRTGDDEYLRAAVFFLNLIYSFEAEKRFNICSEVRQTQDGKRVWKKEKRREPW